MAYHSGLRLPADVERGAKGGPGYKTTVLPLSGGREKRNIEWSRSRGNWDVGYGLQDKSLMTVILDFFHSMEGRAHSFPFKDWSDYEIGVDLTDTYQEVGIGDGAEQDFQIVRRYNTGGVIKDRVIEKPRATVRVFLGAAEQFAGFTVNLSTGNINFSSPPGGAVSVGVICEFDCPVRFDSDDLSVVMEIFSAGMVPSIPLIEVRGEL